MSLFLCHFSSEKKEEYILLELIEPEELFEKLPDYYRKCYITDGDLKNRINMFSVPAESIIKGYIPEPGKTMSGDFAEILSYQLLIDFYEDYSLFGPKKWMWKIDKNEPMKKTDVILFGNNTESPTIHDIIVASEIKSKATKSEFHPIQDGIVGSRDDYVKRLAITLSWLEEQYIRLADINSLNAIKRFINSIDPEYGPYTKHFKTIAVIDSEMVSDEIDREIDFSIKVLKKDWEKIKKESESFGAVYDSEVRKLSFDKVKRDEISNSDSENKNQILSLYDLYRFKIGDYSDITIVSVENLKEVYERNYNDIVTSYKEVKDE